MPAADDPDAVRPTPRAVSGVTLPPERADGTTSLRELATLFLTLGAVSFGGPAAHVAMMEDEVVRRRRWMTRERFLDLVGATNLIPGPNSTELAIHIGHARAGWPGLIVAGISFIVPAVLLVTLMAWGYVRFGTIPALGGVLYGVKPIVIAVVVQALAGLARTALRTRLLWAVGGAATLAAGVGISELTILFAAGVAMAFVERAAHASPSGGDDGTRFVATTPVALGGVSLVQPTVAAPVATIAAAVPFGLWPLLLVFLKAGAVLFGSGYVLLAFLRTDLVERLGWLTERQLLDAVAVGQVTPGPVFTTATFIGYVIGGSGGAAVATLGIFLPAFVFVALSGWALPHLRRSPVAGRVLDGVNVASLALMVVVTWHLGRGACVDPLTGALAIVSTVLLMRRRVNAAILVLGGAVVGLAAAGVGAAAGP